MLLSHQSTVDRPVPPPESITPEIHDALVNLFQLNASYGEVERAKPRAMTTVSFSQWFGEFIFTKHPLSCKAVLEKAGADKTDVDDCGDVDHMYHLVTTKLVFKDIVAKALAN